jgi:hypothetical protein
MLLDPFEIAVELCFRCVGQISSSRGFHGLFQKLHTGRQKRSRSFCGFLFGLKLPLLSATAADADAHARNMDADPGTALVVPMMMMVTMVTTTSIVSVAFALHVHPPRSAVIPATAPLIAHHAHLLDTVIDERCHGVKGRGARAGNE